MTVETGGSGIVSPGEVTGGLTDAARWLTIVIANGQWFGGAFRIAPEATLDDGVLDVVAIGDASPFRRARLFGAAPWGRHVHAPEVRYARTRHLTLRFPARPWYQADGELYQAEGTMVAIDVRPRRLHVII